MPPKPEIAGDGRDSFLHSTRHQSTVLAERTMKGKPTIARSSCCCRYSSSPQVDRVDMPKNLGLAELCP